MIVYISLLIMVSASLLAYRKTRLKLFSILPYIMMTLVCGFRNGVGVDYNSYKDWFYDIIAKRGWYSNTELGFKFLTEGVSIIGGDYQVVFLVMAGVTSFCYYQFIKRHSENFELSTMIYMCFGIFYFSSFNGSREALAISIFLYALKYLNEKCEFNENEYKYSFLKYTMIVIVATMFHKSAFIFVLFPYVARKLNDKHLVHFISITILGAVLIRAGVLDRLLARFFPAYYRYATYEYTAPKSYLLFVGISIFILVLCREYSVNVDKCHLHLLVFSASLIAIMYLTGKYEMLLTRYASWGLPSIIIVLPKLRKVFNPKMVYSSIAYTMCILYFFTTTLRGSMMLPYAFNFNLVR